MPTINCFAISIPADDFYGHRLNNSNTATYSIVVGEKLFIKTQRDLILVLTGA